MRIRYLYQSRRCTFVQTQDLLPFAGARAASRPLVSLKTQFRVIGFIGLNMCSKWYMTSQNKFSMQLLNWFEKCLHCHQKSNFCNKMGYFLKMFVAFDVFSTTIFCLIRWFDAKFLKFPRIQITDSPAKNFIHSKNAYLEEFILLLT